MAHFAKISENNEVLTVLTLDNKDMHNADGVEVESIGQAYLEKHNNWPAELWIQTSYNTYGGTHLSGNNSKAFRGNYAGIGYTWEEDDQIFWPKKPYASWIKNTTTVDWGSPIGDAPELTAEQISDINNIYRYDWNESGQSWDLRTIPIVS
tara:strand:- start:445 stop:897 length:453 start_codon:yes stop_codon:yes gene_type:complete